MSAAQPAKDPLRIAIERLQLGTFSCFYCESELLPQGDWEPMLLVHNADGTDYEHVGVCAQCIAAAHQACIDYVNEPYEPDTLAGEYDPADNWRTYW